MAHHLAEASTDVPFPLSVLPGEAWPDRKPDGSTEIDAAERVLDSTYPTRRSYGPIGACRSPPGAPSLGRLPRSVPSGVGLGGCLARVVAVFGHNP
jgi:hypothetical protein